MRHVVGPPKPKRRAFFSFNFEEDYFRTAQVRNIGVIEGTARASDNEWERLQRQDDATIKRWIDGQMSGRSCTIVLIGAHTYGRKWVGYEIRKSWDDGKGLFGVHIHKLKDNHGMQTVKGHNPFDEFVHNKTGVRMSSVIPVYDPPGYDSKAVYGYISDNIAGWIDDAVTAAGR